MGNNQTTEIDIPIASYGYSTTNYDDNKSLELIPADEFEDPFPGYLYLYYYNDKPGFPDYLTPVSNSEVDKRRKKVKVSFYDKDEYDFVSMDIDRSFDESYLNYYVLFEMPSKLNKNNEVMILNNKKILDAIKYSKEKYHDDLEGGELQSHGMTLFIVIVGLLGAIALSMVVIPLITGKTSSEFTPRTCSCCRNNKLKI